MRKYLTLIVIFILLSCSSNEGNLPEDNLVNDYVGLWKLTELRMIYPQDFNGDGVTSYNVVVELDCLFADITFNSDFTTNLVGMGIQFETISENVVLITCTEISESTNSWEITDEGVKLSNEEFIYSEGNLTLFKDANTIYEFDKIVYTKQ